MTQNRSDSPVIEPIDVYRRKAIRDGIILAGAAFTGILSSCGGGGGGDDESCENDASPGLIEISPADGSVEVHTNATISLRFTEAVNVPTGAITLTGPSGPVTTVQQVASNNVNVTPFNSLTPEQDYKLELSPRITDCSGAGFAGASVDFRTITAAQSLEAGALASDTYLRYRWSSPSAQYNWNVLSHLYSNGVRWLRMWTTTLSSPELRNTENWYTLSFKNEYWSCLEVSGALLKAAARQGFRLHAVLFLSDQAAHAGIQLRPAAWSGLNQADLLLAIENNAQVTASYYQSLGLNIEVFEIGNEIDFGICGVTLDSLTIPPGVDPVNDPIWMRNNLYVNMVPIMNAAIRGVHSVYPEAKILLHIAGFGYSNQNIAAIGFFQSMIALGLPFDIAGFSYPYLISGSAVTRPYFTQAEFLSTLDSVALLGKPMQIVEFNYPAASAGIVHPPAPGSPLTTAGQADFVRDFIEALRGRVQSLHYWYPDYYPGFDNSVPQLESCGLFGANNTPRDALAEFKNV